MKQYLIVAVSEWLIKLVQGTDQPTMLDNFSRDPVANSIAVLVLLAMIGSIIAVVVYFLGDSERRGWRWPKWSVPLLAILGLGVSLYLLYVEATGANAVCGPTGDCNAVQHSPYARLFGIIPVGLMGAAGYIAMLIAWLIAGYGPDRLRKAMTLAVWGMAWFGIAFTVYLTFLEPFVIGATCMWCISSAIIITLIFLASTQPAVEYLRIEEEDFEDEELPEE